MSTKKDKFSINDKLYMELALDLANARKGLTGTNPSVGCVIVKNDQIISIGQTSFKGRPHAEFNAIKNCYEDLKGSKMYVSLEPCCHHGLSAPCTSAIINSKISEVIYSIKDIDKRVRGKTKSILSKKNIIVKTGLLSNKISKFYETYFYNRKNQLPFVTGKIAISKNDLIYSKGNKRITNTTSDKLTHYLRYKNDSIMISYKTLNKDNPRLDCRLRKLKKFSPKRIILDNKLNLSLKSYISKTANRKNTIIFYNEAENSKVNIFKKNFTIIKSKINKNKKFDIMIIMKKLYKMGCRNILVEGGNILTSDFLKKRFYNQFYLFRSPKKISILNEFKKFEGLNVLNKKYKNKHKLKSNFGKDNVMLYIK